MSYVTDQSGFSLIIAVIMILIFAIVSVTVASLVSTDSTLSLYELRSTDALYVTRAGIERVLYQFKNGTACASLAYTNSLGSGSFTTTGNLYNPGSTMLSSGISSSTTTVPVNSTTGYAPHGRITIDSETLDYTGTTPTSFTGARRGAAGSTADIHSSGASVSQNHCLIRSTGTISITGLGTAQRVVEVGVQ
jgi:Tfp pilus assembly protein PilX